MTELARESQDLPRKAPDAPTGGGVPAGPPTKVATRLPTSAQQLRRARARKLIIRFSVWTGVPTVLAILYFGLLASPQYDSTAEIAVESALGRTQSDAASKSSGDVHDARLLRTYIRSSAMLGVLRADHQFREHYSDDAYDWWSRVARDASDSELLEYFHDKVTIKIDGHILSLTVRAFTPARAQELAQAIVARSEAWIEELTERSRKELVDPAEAGVMATRTRLATVRQTAGADPVDLELAEEELEAALDGLQAAQLEAARAGRYLVVIAPPSRPDAVSRPRPRWDIATVAVTALVLTAVLSLLGAAVREHANF